MALHFVEPDHLQIGIEPPYDAEPADWPFNATKVYLLDGASLAKTARKLTAPVDELYKGGYEEQARESVFFIHQTFCAMLPQIPYNHPGHLRLAILVVDLLNQPASSSGEVERASPWANVRLPECRYSQGPADEMMKLEPGETGYYPQYETDGADLGIGAIKDEWTRHNAFLARLTPTPGAPNVEKYPLIALQGALEESSMTIGGISANIPAAAVWMLYAGDYVYKCRSVWPEHFKPAEGGPLWNGIKGYCLERWALWKSRFEWVITEEGMTDEAKQLAELAVNAMEEIEKASNQEASINAPISQ